MTEDCGKDTDNAAFVGNHQRGGHVSCVWDSTTKPHDYHSRLAERLTESFLCTCCVQ